jgi:hypothetical protein
VERPQRRNGHPPVKSWFESTLLYSYLKSDATPTPTTRAHRDPSIPQRIS